MANSTLSSPESFQISLSVSYITHSAYWFPRYGLSLNTITSSGLTIYHADYCNTTSEEWKDAQVILSTSQTAFQGPVEPRNGLFGLDGLPFIPRQAQFKDQPQAMVLGSFGSSFVASNVPSSNAALFDSSNAGNSSLEGNRALQDYQMQIMLLEQEKKRRRLMMAQYEQDTVSGAGGIIVPELPTLEPQESEWTESVRSPQRWTLPFYTEMRLETSFTASLAGSTDCGICV